MVKDPAPAAREGMPGNWDAEIGGGQRSGEGAIGQVELELEVVPLMGGERRQGFHSSCLLQEEAIGTDPEHKGRGPVALPHPEAMGAGRGVRGGGKTEIEVEVKGGAFRRPASGVELLGQAILPIPSGDARAEPPRRVQVFEGALRRGGGAQLSLPDPGGNQDPVAPSGGILLDLKIAIRIMQ